MRVLLAAIGWLLIVTPAVAKPRTVITVPQTVRPVVAPANAPEQFARFLADKKRKPAELACGPLWAEVAMLCFRVREGQTQRWATTDDLREWEVSVTDLRTLMVGRGVLAMTESARVVPIDGMDAKTVQIADPEGFSAVAVADPKLLEQILGGRPLLAAVPTTEVVVAWRPDDEDVNKAVAVSIHEAWESGPNAVTPQIFMWTGQHWLPYLEARPLDPSPSGEEGAP